MHCNLRPSDVALVVLGCNYESHDASVYNINNSTTSDDPQ